MKEVLESHFGLNLLHKTGQFFPKANNSYLLCIKTVKGKV